MATETVSLAGHRLELANEALAEIVQASSALLAYIAEQDTTRSVISLSRGMLSRILTLSNIASECIASDEGDRRPDGEILRELTGLPGSSPDVQPSAGDSDEVDEDDDEPVDTPAPAAPEHPEQDSAAAPASDDAIEVARFAIAGLRAWRLLLPTDLDHIDTKAASQPQLVLRAIINFLEGAFEGPGNDLPPRQAAALLETVEAELWKVGTFELKSVSVDWCTRVAGMASAILEASVQAEDAADGAGPATPASGDDADRLRRLKGAAAFHDLLGELAAVPEVLRPGMQPGQDDSTVPAVHAAQATVLASMTRHGFQVRDRAEAEGFATAMASELIAGLGGLSIDARADTQGAARTALDDLNDARDGTPVAKPEQAADPAR